ncbi:MAG: hypothetical protein ACYDEV_05465 [Acidiferrobacter sp.]
MMIQNRSLHSPCAGQALVETLIAALFVLVPIFLLYPLLGKYIDLKAQTVQAARYTAFERTAFSASGTRDGATVAQASNAALSGWTTLRFFGAPTAALTSTAPQSGAYTINPLWTDQSGQPLLPRYADVQTTLANAASPDLADQALETYLKPIQVLSEGGPTLNFQGFVTANIQAAVAPVVYPPPLNTLKLRFTASDTLLTDAWSAAGPPGVQTQIDAALPRLEPALKTLMNVAQTGGASDLQSLNLGQVLTGSPQELPADRLHSQNGAGAP